MVAQLVALKVMDQEPELDELCELLAGLELIQRCAEGGRGEDMASNEALTAVGSIADGLTTLVRSLDDTHILDLEKIQGELKRLSDDENTGVRAATQTGHIKD